MFFGVFYVLFSHKRIFIANATERLNGSKRFFSLNGFQVGREGPGPKNSLVGFVLSIGNPSRSGGHALRKPKADKRLFVVKIWLDSFFENGIQKVHVIINIVEPRFFGHPGSTYAPFKTVQVKPV